MQIDPAVFAQLDDLRAWSATAAVPKEISLLDYVGLVGTPDTLFGFAELFWPTLVTHDGVRFLAAGFTAETYDAWRKQGRSKVEIQRVMNHLHISTLLQQQEISDEAAMEAARVIVMMWNRTLGPEGLVAKAYGSTLEDAQVTFFERDATEDVA